MLRKQNNAPGRRLPGKRRNVVRLNTRMPMAAPPFNPTSTIVRRHRFIATGQNLADTITFNELGNLIVVGTGTTNAYQLFDHVKILKISIWSPPQATNGTFGPTTNSCSIEFSSTTAGYSGRSNRISDTATSMTASARCTLRPDPSSQTSNWQPVHAGAITAFILGYGTGAVIDVTLMHTMTDSSRVLVVSLTNTVTVGQVYYLALDGPAVNNLVPAGNLPTIN